MTIKSPHTCPSADLLRQLECDDFSPAELEVVEEHVSCCDRCRDLLEVAQSDPQWHDEIVSVLRASQEPKHLANEHDDGGHGGESMASILRLLGPTEDPHMLGRIGSYEVVGVIGRGGMGVVFKAYDGALNRFVAIKMLLPHLAASGAARKRFAREGQAAAAVIDDNVMPIYSVAEWQGVPYLVTQYTRGVTLQKRIQDQGPLELKEILRIGMQTARGLAAAHAQGLVHRDVKPSNILLDGTVERALLTDFGLARAVDDASITRTGIIAGTPQYMSPEQARAETVDHRSDLFSLGSVLYAMCTGRAPFRGESSYSVLRLITDKEPRPIREINPEIPEWLCTIIGKLMAKQAGDRFAWAQEVAELLEDCLAHVQQPTTTPLPDPVANLATTFGPAAKNHSTESLGGFRYPPIGKFIAAAAFAFSLIFAGMLIVLEINKGTLTIECEADDVPIQIMQGNKVVKEMTVTKSAKSTRIAAGSYVVTIDGPTDKLAVQDGRILLRRGGNEVVKIVHKQGASDTESVSDTMGVLHKVSIGTPKTMDVTLTDQYVCRIQSKRQFPVLAPTTGRLETIRTNEGQVVAEGEVLFQIKAGLANEEPDSKQPLSISAPFAGTVGAISQEMGTDLQLGAFLTTITDDGHMDVFFNVPEAHYLRYKEARATEHTDELDVELVLSDRSKFNQHGRLISMGTDFNPKTGNITFRAEFPNPDRLLRNGMTGVLLVNRVQKNAIVIPQSATFEQLDKRYVFVVNRENVAHQRQIDILAEKEDVFLVKAGISVEDRIVVDGVRSLMAAQNQKAEVGKDRLDYAEVSDAEKVSAPLSHRQPMHVHTAEASHWIPARPLKVTVSRGGSAKILDDDSVRLEGDLRWQEVSVQYEFDKPTKVEEIRLEILPVDSPAGPQLGRGGDQLILFDVKPSIKDQDAIFTSLEFASCTYLQSPSDETTADCIDNLSDTGWKVPPLPADAAAHELVLRFEKPIALRADQRLTFTVDSGGAKELAVLNRIRFAFRQGAYEEAMTPIRSNEHVAETADDVTTKQHNDAAKADRLETGKVVLHAIDADTGEPIRDVVFVKENLLGEDWAKPVGSSDADGLVSTDLKPLPGYFFSILHVPQGYKVTSLDEMPAHVEVGRRVDYRFHLRRLGTNLEFVKNVPESNAAGHRFAEALKETDKNGFRIVVNDMPGFREGPVTFTFARDKAPLAERIFANGELVRAAVQDELRYFEKAEGNLAGKISELYDIQVVISSSTLPRAPATSWYLHCRTKDGIELKQDGFRIRFEDLDHWDLEIPAFLHPEF